MGIFDSVLEKLRGVFSTIGGEEKALQEVRELGTIRPPNETIPKIKSHIVRQEFETLFRQFRNKAPDELISEIDKLEKELGRIDRNITEKNAEKEPRLIVFGRTTLGKSTFLYAVSKGEIDTKRGSGTQNTTKEVRIFHVNNVADVPVIFVDTPGTEGFGAGDLEEKAIEEAKKADILILICDEVITQFQREHLARFVKQEKPILALYNVKAALSRENQWALDLAKQGGVFEDQKLSEIEFNIREGLKRYKNLNEPKLKMLQFHAKAAEEALYEKDPVRRDELEKLGRMNEVRAEINRFIKEYGGNSKRNFEVNQLAFFLYDSKERLIPYAQRNEDNLKQLFNKKSAFEKKIEELHNIFLSRSETKLRKIFTGFREEYSQIVQSNMESLMPRKSLLNAILSFSMPAMGAVQYKMELDRQQALLKETLADTRDKHLSLLGKFSKEIQRDYEKNVLGGIKEFSTDTNETKITLDLYDKIDYGFARDALKDILMKNELRSQRHGTKFAYAISALILGVFGAILMLFAWWAICPILCLSVPMAAMGLFSNEAFKYSEHARERSSNRNLMAFEDDVLKKCELAVDINMQQLRKWMNESKGKLVEVYDCKYTKELIDELENENAAVSAWNKYVESLIR